MTTPLKKIFFVNILSIVIGLYAASSMGLDLTRDLKNHTVHYTIFDSALITPEVAEQYQLKRDPKLAYINIAIIPKTGGFGIEANKLKGDSSNLLQQKTTLEFTTIREKNAVYYLAPVPFFDREVMHFDISIKATEASEQEAFRFTRKLYKSESR